MALPEKECYQCGKLKTALNYKSRCLTCVTERNDFNENENESLRYEIAKLAATRDALQNLITECTIDGGINPQLFNMYMENYVKRRSK